MEKIVQAIQWIPPIFLTHSQDIHTLFTHFIIIIIIIITINNYASYSYIKSISARK